MAHSGTSNAIVENAKVSKDDSLLTNALTLSKLPYDVAPRVHLHGHMLPPSVLP